MACTNEHWVENIYVQNGSFSYLHDSGLPIEKGSCLAGQAFRSVSNKRHKSTFILRLRIMHWVLEPPAWEQLRLHSHNDKIKVVPTWNCVEFNQSDRDTWQLNLKHYLACIQRDKQPLTFSFRQRITSWIVHLKNTKLKNTDDLDTGYHIMESCVVSDWR